MNATEQTANRKPMEFLYAFLACSALTFATIRLEFESGGPAQYVLPFIPAVFIFTYWFSKKTAHYAIALGALVPAYFFLGALNTVALAGTIAAYVFVLSVFKKTKVRILAALLLTGILAFLRIGFVNLPVIPLAAPVAGSMIMFRFVLMLYEHHYGKPQATWMQQFTYLLLPPALAFPLFPIVDYKTYLNNHRPQDARVIRTGLTRIAAGLVFMMTYRVLYLYFIPGYVEVHDALSAFAYTVCNYLYILNVLGVLWMSAGYLGVLGFDLPQVFNYVFLIDSFRDIWRRINVYWRDFIVKLVYYPLYFKLRKKTKAAILITSLITLTISALLHGWQWFWLQGTLVVSAAGILFWTIIGFVISINLALQKQEGTNGNVRPNIYVHALRITGMFLFMSFMWSLWNSTSLEEWFNLLSYYGEGNARQWLTITGTVIAIIALHVLIQRRAEKPAGHHVLNQPYHPALLIAVCALFLVPALPALTEKIPGATGAFITAVSEARLNKADESAATENYYNRMLASDGLGTRPWEVHTPGGTAKSGLDEACVRREDLLVRELIPNRVTVLNGWTIQTNSYGMRDREYAVPKPEGVYRIAVLGASYEMGSGVAQDSVFEALLENMLNDSVPQQRIEVLNFSVGGYHLPQQVWVAEKKLPQFQPDLVLCFVHPVDAARTSDYMANMVSNGTDLHYAELYTIRKEAGAEQRMSQKILVNRFFPFANRITEWSLLQVKRASEKAGAYYATVYLPSLGDADDLAYYKQLHTQHSGNPEWDNGLLLFDLSGVYGAHPEYYQLANDPTHPNAAAHARIAGMLAAQLTPVVRSKAQQP